MSKPIVAVVGRPNVGKSTLVNRLAERREAIVHESRGVTRDRSYHDTDWNGREFTLIDTGGIESVKSKDTFAPRIREQALAACDEADVILFVVDGQTGLTDEDEEVARVVRRSKKPVFLIVNKQDNPAEEGDLWNFYSLGVGEPRAISASHGYGTGDLLDEIVAAFRSLKKRSQETRMAS
jgi:GTP-binding protein